MDNSCSRALSRRTVITAAAWSVPVIAVAGAIPAIAASTTCKTGAVVAMSQGTWTKTGSLLSSQAAYTGWLPANSGSGHASGSYVGDAKASGFTSGADSDGNQVVITAPYLTFVPIAGATYTVTFSVVVGYGVYSSSTAYSERQSVLVEAVQTVGSKTNTTAVKGVTLTHSNKVTRSDSTMAKAGYTPQAPSAGKVPYSGTFTASGSGAVTIRYTLTMDKRYSSGSRQNYVNDDVWISDPAVTVSVCPK